MVKTRLQVAANVNYDVFVRYLEWMVGRGLVSLENASDGHERVVLTPKGREAYRKLVQWIHEAVHGPAPANKEQPSRSASQCALHLIEVEVEVPSRVPR